MSTKRTRCEIGAAGGKADGAQGLISNRPNAATSMHGLKIGNPLICDGSGGLPEPGGLAVTGSRIDAVDGAVGAARQTFDADGLVLAPGIIEIHIHHDGRITRDPMPDPSPRLGVTTAITGNCGFSIAPCKHSDRDLRMRNLVRVEGMSTGARRAGIDWSFLQYLDAVEAKGFGPNAAALAGHPAMCIFVMAEDV